MHLNGSLALACLTLALAAPAAPQEKRPDTNASRTLKVKLNYTGSGQVDGKHRIFVFLFDSPDLSETARPFASMSTAAKADTLVFAGIPHPAVYVVAAYDPAGEYDGQSGPPPAGSSIAAYPNASNTPEPVKIEPGGTASIDLSFDDSVKIS